MPDYKTIQTILIGDEIATGLDKALRALPNTLPLWTVAVPGWPILPWAADDAIGKIKDIEDKWAAKGGDPKMPTRVIVSAGRFEMLFEPPDLSAKDLADFADDVKKVVGMLKDRGELIWILPPAITGERKTRSVLAQALADSGVRVLDASQFVADPKASRDKPAPADLPDDAYNAMAKKLKAWIPMGPSPFSNIVLTSPSPARGALDRAKTGLRGVLESVSAWPTPAKVAGAVAVAGVILGAVHVASKPKERK